MTIMLWVGDRWIASTMMFTCDMMTCSAIANRDEILIGCLSLGQNNCKMIG